MGASESSVKQSLGLSRMRNRAVPKSLTFRFDARSLLSRRIEQSGFSQPSQTPREGCSWLTETQTQWAQSLCDGYPTPNLTIKPRKIVVREIPNGHAPLGTWVQNEISRAASSSSDSASSMAREVLSFHVPLVKGQGPDSRRRAIATEPIPASGAKMDS